MHTRLRFLIVGLVVVAAIALYGSSLRSPVFFDDIRFFKYGILNDVFLRGLAIEPRWLVYFSTAWINLVFDGSIFAQRMVNLALHLATVFLLYSLVKQISNHVALHRHNERAAIAAAVLFMLHPLAVYAVGYLIQRTILMGTLFGLLALSAYFDGLITRKKFYFVFSVMFYLLAISCKEHTLSIAFVALAITPLAISGSVHIWKRSIWPGLAFLLVAIAIALIGKATIGLGQAYEPVAQDLIGASLVGKGGLEIWGLSILTQASLFFKYLLLILFPYPGWMSIDMRVPFAESLLQLKYLLGLVAFFVYGCVALWMLLKGGRRGMAGFAMLAPLLLFTVEFSAIRIQEPFVLYRTYLWMPFLLLALPILTNNLSGKVFWPLLLLASLGLFAASSNRLATFGSNFLLWDDAIAKLPEQRVLGSARAYNNRAQQYFLAGNFQAALLDYNHAFQAGPLYRTLYRDRALTYSKLGQFERAMRDANDYIRYLPTDPSNFELVGMLHLEAGNLDKALKLLGEACRVGEAGACYGYVEAKRRLGKNAK